MGTMPSELETERLTIRKYKKSDAEELGMVIAANDEHLRPWMQWMSKDPISLEQRVNIIEVWASQWDETSDFEYGIYKEDELIGGVALRKRIGPGGYEISYWLTKSSTKQGFMTESVKAISIAALELDDVDRIEIHHDVTNIPSKSIPTLLNYEMILDSSPTEKLAPNETGIEYIWRLTNTDHLI